MLAFVAGISMLTGLVFGLIPAMRATQVDLSSAMKENSRSVAASRTWLSKALLITQVAVSVVLLIGAGLFVRTLQNLRSVDVGFNPGNILMFRINPALNRYSTNAPPSSMSACGRRSRRLPGVQAVSFTRTALLSGSTSTTGIYRQGATTEKEVNDFYIMSVSPKFFATMQIPVLRGRDFNERDVADADGIRAHQRDRGEEVLPERRSDRPARRPVARGKRSDGDRRHHPRHQVRQRARPGAADHLHLDSPGDALAHRDGAHRR